MVVPGKSSASCMASGIVKLPPTAVTAAGFLTGYHSRVFKSYSTARTSGLGLSRPSSGQQSPSGIHRAHRSSAGAFMRGMHAPLLIARGPQSPAVSSVIGLTLVSHSRSSSLAGRAGSFQHWSSSAPGGEAGHPSQRRAHTTVARSAAGAAGAAAAGLSAARASSTAAAHAVAVRLSGVLAAVAAYLPFLPAAPAAGASLLSLRPPSLQPAAAAVQGWLQSGVLGAAAAASWKLLLVCLAVGWLLSRGHLPADTATVLSKVSFNLLIPCMLFTKVASTLVSTSQWMLFSIPLAAALQILAGWIFSRGATLLVSGSYSRRIKILGWHPLNPSAETKSIAAATSAAAGIPEAAPALYAPEPPLPEGTLEMVRACCMFGNSMTLPLVFMASLLAPAVNARAVGYLALYQMAWSPLLWALAPRVLHPSKLVQPGGQAPLSLPQRVRLLPAAFRSHLQRVGLKGVLRYWVGAVRRAVMAFVRGVLGIMNLPLVGVFMGLAVGLTPLGGLLFPPAAAGNPGTAMPAGWSWETATLVGMLRAAMDLMGTLGDATLAASAIVLGASMFPPNGNGSKAGSSNSSGNAPARTGLQSIKMMLSHEPMSSSGRPTVRSIEEAMMPKPKPKGSFERRVRQVLRLGLGRADARALAVVAAVRLLLMPLASIAIVKGLMAKGWMSADPVVLLVVMLQGAMPTAQNLIVLLHLDEKTRGGATRLAEMLLRLYALAIVPLTIWVTVFVSLLPGPLPTL